MSTSSLHAYSRGARHVILPAENAYSTSQSYAEACLRSESRWHSGSKWPDVSIGSLWRHMILRDSCVQDERGSGCKIRAASRAEDKISAARRRRIEKGREESERKNAERAKTYPGWARVLEEGAKDDKELREILGGSLGDPEEMRKQIESRFNRKSSEMLQPKSGSAQQMQIVFHDFDPFDVKIWLELYSAPTEEAVEILGTAIRSWYVMGQLGAYNMAKMQLSRLNPEASYKFDPSVDAAAMPALFHSIGNLEFQDNLARFWVDMGTSDPVALDMLITALANISSDHVGIKCLTFGAKRVGDWEEGMTNEEDGYICYEI